MTRPEYAQPAAINQETTGLVNHRAHRRASVTCISTSVDDRSGSLAGRISTLFDAAAIHSRTSGQAGSSDSKSFKLRTGPRLPNDAAVQRRTGEGAKRPTRPSDCNGGVGQPLHGKPPQGDGLPRRTARAKASARRGNVTVSRLSVSSLASGQSAFDVQLTSRLSSSTPPG